MHKKPIGERLARLDPNRHLPQDAAVYANLNDKLFDSSNRDFVNKHCKKSRSYKTKKRGKR